MHIFRSIITPFARLLLSIFLLVASTSKIAAAAPLTLGILGDSNTDEYRADDNRAGSTQYASTTLNWAELLVNKRGVNIGTWGTWGEPRRSGYKYNWSRSGATSASMISSGQHTGLAQQVASGEVQHVIIFIGTNDFHTWNGTYNEVYNNILTDAQVQQKIDSIVSKITLAVDTLKSAGAVKIIVTNYADPALAVDFMTQFPNAQKRARVTNAVTKINQGLVSMSQSRQIVLADISSMATTLLSKVDANGFLNINGESISITQHGDEPHHMQLADSVGHVGTVMNGIIANFFIRSIQTGYNINLVEFSDQELLRNAGIQTAVSTITQPTARKGDGNGDGTVNGLDYIIWLTNFGTHPTSGANKGDYNGDTSVNGLDYILWLTNFDQN